MKRNRTQITKESIAAFFTTHEMLLLATQPKLCVPVINRIYIKMTAGIRFAGIKIDGNLLCDGHHRYVASLLANVEMEKYPTLATSATQQIDWRNIILEDGDWDTEAKIKMLNEQDAFYNSIATEELNDLLQ